MHNPEQAMLDNDSVINEARKVMIRKALEQGPGFANTIAQRMGEKSDSQFVALLHEMEADMEITFNWLRGYKL